MSRSHGGPLAGLKVVEMQGLGPAPFGMMMLSDLGAEVIRVDRVETVRSGADDLQAADVLGRGRTSIGVDLKSPEGAEVVLKLIETADILVEGFRPGVMERLGLGPDVALGRNPRLIYGRMTGWGQDGPWAKAAGHDINYIALSGALWPIGRDNEAPVPPLNLLGDFGGGGMLLVVGILAAVFERSSSGRGQVIDVAMVDGAGLLNSLLYALKHVGVWGDKRSDNLLDTGAPYYEVYETSDGKWVSVGSIEPKFYANLMTGLGLEFDEATKNDKSQWPARKAQIAGIFRTRTRDEWEQHFGDDVCFAPVLSPWEAPDHPHARAREAFTDAFGIVQPSPAPRFGRTPARIAGPPVAAGAQTDEIMAAAGFTSDEIAQLRRTGTVA